MDDEDTIDETGATAAVAVDNPAYLRQIALHTAAAMHNPGHATAEQIVKEANQFLAFLDGSDAKTTNH
jgi:hypothetical protein